MPDAPGQPDNPRSYDAYFSVTGQGFHIRNPNHGVTVSGDGIAWTADGRAHDAAFATIAAIHLQTAALGNTDKVIDQCRIVFIDGTALTVANTSSSGLPDPTQTPVYRDFVRDLHARLAARPPGAIRFTAGLARWRYNGLLISMIAAGLLFILTPLGIVLFTGDLKGFGYMIAGGLLCWPFVRMLVNNAPRDYTPDRLPDELLS